MTNNKYFEKMYSLDPREWALFAGVIVEDGFQYVVAGDEKSAGEASESYTSKCQHCNKNIKHYVILDNKTNGDRICVGFDCYNNTFAQDSREQLDMYRAKQKAQNAIARQIKEENTTMFKAEHCELIAFMEKNQYNNFFASLLANLNHYGNLTENQLHAAYKAMEKMSKPKDVGIEAKDAPTGKIIDKFVVISTKWVDNMYGGSLKMLVQHATDNYRVFCTVPAKLTNVQKGDEITLKVTLTPSDNDPKFAYGKRPSLA